MRINIGTTNKTKIEAVNEVLREYRIFKGAIIKSFSTESGVSDQPKTLAETVKGAKNRAIKAFSDCDYSFGIEDGLMKVPGSITGYMNACVCAIFDGKKYSIGTGPGFEYPIKATEMVIKKGKDMSQAYYELGYTKNNKLGEAEGAIGILTKGRIPRKDTAKYAIMMALIQIENKELY